MEEPRRDTGEVEEFNLHEPGPNALLSGRLDPADWSSDSDEKQPPDPYPPTRSHVELGALIVAAAALVVGGLIAVGAPEAALVLGVLVVLAVVLVLVVNPVRDRVLPRVDRLLDWD